MMILALMRGGLIQIIEVKKMTMPIKVIEEFMNKRISMLMKDSRILEGVLIGYDEYMNLIINDTEERMNESVRKLGVVIVRGNNILRIASK